MVAADLDGVVQSWNKAAERMFGYTSEEITGRPVTLLIPQDRQQQEMQILARIRHGEQVDDYETARVAKDGRRIPVSLSVTRIRDGGGNTVGVLTSARDISEQKEAERAKARLAAIVDTADDAIISKDLDGIIQSWNKGAEGIFGYTAQEMIGRSITRLLPADRQDEERQILQRIRRGERVDHYETLWRAKDGRDIPVSVTVSPIKDSRGSIIGASKIARDISAQKLTAALALRQEQERAAELQAVIDAVPAAMLVAEDTKCGRVRANRAGEELLQALRASAGETAHAGELPGELARLRDAARGEEVRNWEVRAVLAEGREHHFLGNAVPLRDTQGRVWGALAALTDITERKRAEAALCEADRRKDQFLAMLAHELRNPLTPIRTALELIHKGLGDQRRREWALEVIDRQLVQLTRLIDDLLEIGRIANGEITLHREPTSLRAVISQALETARPLIGAARHVLEVNLPLQEIRLHADRSRLAQAISNLLANAAKFTPPGGVIAITALRGNGAVELRIKDSGRGMEAELIPHVFDMFVQGATDLSRREGGLGVGLSIVRRIIELHGGTVSAVSEGKNKGSEFVLTLPFAEDVPATESDDRGMTAPKTKSRRVLIVDDNRDVADSIAELFRMSGHEVRTHYEGTGVLDQVHAFRPDAAIIDLGLPGKTGYEVATLLRAHPELSALPLIALSGYGQPADIERSRSVGFNFHLLKPADPKLLVQLVEMTRPSRPER